MYSILTITVDKATPNKFLDSHPNFVKNWGGKEVFIFYFLDCFKNRTVLKETFNTMKFSKLEDLKVLKRSPDLLNNVKIGQGRLIIQTYFVLPYMGNDHFDQMTKKRYHIYSFIH